MQNRTKEFQIRMSPAQARALSLGVLAALVAGYLADAIFPEMPRLPFVAVGVLKLGGLVGAILLFLSNYGQLSQRCESALDEREIQIRNRAYVTTHQIMVATLFFSFFYLEIATKAGWWLPGPDEAPGLVNVFGIVAMALPAAILAWRDRTVPEEA